MLDTTSFGWSKWNDNGGGIEGKAYHAPLDIEYQMKTLHQPALSLKSLGGVIEEGSEDEEDSDDESEEGVVESTTFGRLHITGRESQPTVDPRAYLQAFSHFMQAFTNRKVLVCDLQGVYNTSTVPPRFELTDPAIHYRSKKRHMVYGRTDKGLGGIKLFFITHKCSDVCKMVNLSIKNVEWHRAWCRHHQQLYSKSGSA